MSGISDNFVLQTTTLGVVDVSGLPTDANVLAVTGTPPVTGMMARDNTTQLVYVRASDGSWPDLYPLSDANHSQLTGLTADDHPQYHSILKVADGSVLGTVSQSQEKYIQNRNTPMYSDGVGWMSEADGQERFVLASGLYYGPPINTSGGSAIAGTGIQRCAPWFLHRRTTFQSLTAHANTAVASSVIRPAIWADDGTGHPGALVVDGGADLSCNVTDTDVVQAITFTLDPGLYWVGGIMNVSPNMRTVNGTNSQFALVLGADTFTNYAFTGYSRTPGAGAPTNPFGTPTTTATVPAVRLRVT